ncbi:hypothetical protein [Glycomyces harbinensis]|uniref:Uncharacterized protein n=1 Tax=Glycomyces harbinensis TaxID=58114 RepID=A0A1G6QPA4_9ACTN|nr:hypothetical protein [Glycomyces harbinensis]SDC94159.1 hypothetical protein SAMN05216270_10130 [Glycomyces harbinensis]
MRIPKVRRTLDAAATVSLIGTSAFGDDTPTSGSGPVNGRSGSLRLVAAR